MSVLGDSTFLPGLLPAEEPQALDTEREVVLERKNSVLVHRRMNATAEIPQTTPCQGSRFGAAKGKEVRGAPVRSGSPPSSRWRITASSPQRHHSPLCTLEVRDTGQKLYGCSGESISWVLCGKRWVRVEGRKCFPDFASPRIPRLNRRPLERQSTPLHTPPSGSETAGETPTAWTEAAA